ncbi:MAG: hypothetical protein MJ219_00410 [Mycoplasmoidaceae bacterium]|nr:hypothetical protein [Mycoplasmoidaceae bacterium]
MLKKQFYLFIRAEKLVIAKNLDEMLDFNIKELLENYNFEDDIYIFVDSIESISESNFKFNLLLDLFYVTQKFNRVHILLSCRTFDKINFIKLISNRKLSLEELEIKQLSSGQMMPICKKFKLVDQIITSNKLPSAIKHLLNVPFYLNQIVTHVNSIDEINNIDKLQNLF